MGLFNLFRSVDFPRTDKVWQIQEAKLKGTLDFLKQTKVDFCIAWFENTRDQFLQYLTTEYQLNIEIKLAKSLFPYSLDNKSVLFFEHYPLYSKEENILASKNIKQVWFVNSLDDPIFEMFGQNIGSLMEKMGMTKDECVEHKLISKSIVNAQKKLEKEVRSDFPAYSGDDWIRQFQSTRKKAF